ncbi:Predicted arabinose efflux permease, MFS family [Colwellia chukchiensis]|uniref:Predicted arabinose efflux permease, MFS family n=1 Tax=Colwellia chukchiensis TaxID=641665 RepID=A0A1H7QL26_9GAMM|nr:MFS transporter [Colwellia chukchiensis]SEL48499.1 Predicted arabinose efflux permease, MFS family [Colwellia chukchiensis]
MSASGLNSIEKKAAFSLASVFGLRMLGLFMILPVFAIYGEQLIGYSPIWLGLAIGAYGLTQALLQIPMGILSDKFGRKPVILAGLVLFLLGSIVAATSDTIYGVVLGRAMQGMGAIASAILALAADLSREEQRPKVMATIGMFIGLSFTFAMILGPIVAQAFGLSGLFWFIAVLTIFAMLTIQFVVPNSINTAPKGDNVALPSKLKSLMFDGQLSRLNSGVFILHMALTAVFVTLPKQFVANGLALEQHWQLYLPTLFGSFFLMVPFMIMAIKKQKETAMFSAAVALLALALLLLWYLPSSMTSLVVLVLLFFTAFNYLEATMPSILSRLAPAGVKGSVMGIYSSSQFLGAFAGGVIGGFIASEFGEQSIFLVMAVCTILWLLLSLGMQPLQKSKAYSFATNISTEQQAQTIAQRLASMPGVIEATIMPDEAVAYLKVDDQLADLNHIKTLLNHEL